MNMHHNFSLQSAHLSLNLCIKIPSCYNVCYLMCYLMTCVIFPQHHSQMRLTFKQRHSCNKRQQTHQLENKQKVGCHKSDFIDVQVTKDLYMLILQCYVLMTFCVSECCLCMSVMWLSTVIFSIGCFSFSCYM